jgi:Leucine-rich repeat (LRR) protein
MWCSFKGVSCGTDSSRLDYRRVLSISLPDCRLDGYLTPLGNLTEMIHFFGGSNIISGSIPQSFLSMPKMLNLYLNDNQLIGSIPPITSVNTQLTSLSLGNNSLVGRIPESLSMMKGLTRLNLGRNTLDGTIPSALGQLASLGHLYLESNSLSGTIPSTLRRLDNLKLLYLERNMLTGTIPVLDQPSLQVINLSGNYLTMGSLEGVPMSTFSAAALALHINLHSNCLVFRNPRNPSQNADATHCRGERVLPITYI